MREGSKLSTRVTPECRQERSAVRVDVGVFGLFDKQATDHGVCTGNDDQVPQAVEHVAGLGHDREAVVGIKPPNQPSAMWQGKDIDVYGMRAGNISTSMATIGPYTTVTNNTK